MRILLVNHNVAWSGGTFFRAYPFGRELARRGHAVTLLAISPRRRLSPEVTWQDGVEVIETPDLLWGSARSGWDPWNAWSRLRLVRRRRWDLVHAFDSRPAVIGPALALQRRGVPLVMDWADWWGRGGVIEVRAAGARLRPLLRHVETFFEEAFRRRADATTVISSALRGRAVALGVQADSIVHIPQGADVDGITPLAIEACRHTLGLPIGSLVVGHLGALSLADAELLVGALAALRRRVPDAQLLLMGNPRVEVPQVAGLTKVGFVAAEQLALHLGACDMMMLPLKDTVSSRGRWPSKLGDYLAAGRPVVATAVGDAQQLFADHDIGATAADDAEALAEGCSTLWSDDERRLTRGVRARQLAETRLTWRHLTDVLEQHYALAIARHAARQTYVRSPKVPGAATPAPRSSK